MDRITKAVEALQSLPRSLNNEAFGWILNQLKHELPKAVQGLLSPMQKVAAGIYHFSSICVQTEGKYLPAETINQVLLPLQNAHFEIVNDVQNMATYSINEGFNWKPEILDQGLVTGVAPVSITQLFKNK